MISLPPGTEHLPLDVREGIQCLFVLLRSHSDPRRALDAALKAVVNLGVTAAIPSTHEAVVGRPDSAGPGPADPARYVEEPLVARASQVAEDGNPASPPLPYSLDCYPKCKSLIEHYNLAAPAKKKNPLLILNEYANKLNLEVRGHTCRLVSSFRPHSVLIVSQVGIPDRQFRAGGWTGICTSVMVWDHFLEVIVQWS
jgi:hypothetical protein